MRSLCKILVTAFLCLCGPRQAYPQEQEIVQLLLNVEKLSQFKQILDDMKKGYVILNGGYNTVKNIAEGNFSIHRTFLDGLMAVSPQVRDYRKVPAIVEQQVLLVKEYKAAHARFARDGTFHKRELEYMQRVYGNLFQKSLRSLDELALLLTAGKLRMSDDERLRGIDRIHAEMTDKLRFLRAFNNGSTILSLQREKANRDNRALRALYRTTNE